MNGQINKRFIGKTMLRRQEKNAIEVDQLIIKDQFYTYSQGTSPTIIQSPSLSSYVNT